MKKIFFALLLISNIVFSQNFSNGFPFTIPYDDSSTQRFLPQFPAFTIGNNHKVTTDTLGHFIANGKPIRFWGVNITTSGAFPTHFESILLAARMRKLGINLVRFHHLDNPWAGDSGSLFELSKNYSRKLNPTTLEKLDFLLNELKKNGIYVDMNLNVSRPFFVADGVSDADSIQEFGKFITYYDPYLQYLQREYATQLLGHTNPYTGLKIGQDPVIAMIETNNENTLYGAWKDNALKPQSDGGVLTHRHSNMLDSLWNAFLIKKYTNNANLVSSWGSPNTTINNLITNGGFESGTTSWNVELHDVANAVFTVDNTTANTGTNSGKLVVNTVSGTDWHIQFKNTGASIQKDSIYSFSFYAKSNANKILAVSVVRNNAPYTWYDGFNCNLTTSWKLFTFNLKAPEDNNGNLRLSFSPNQNVATYWLDDVVFEKAKVSGLKPIENLGQKNIARIPWSERFNFTDQRVADQAEFLIGLQKKHIEGMRTYMRDSLNVTAPITGTNALVGPADVMTSENLDFLDDHTYWDHPQFPGIPWSNTDWLINNTSSLKSNELNHMAKLFSGLKFKKKPYTISEFNHTEPNIYRSEMVPMMTGYASYHGADAIMFFTYSDDNVWNSFSNNYFSLKKENAVLSLFPSCAFAYRNGMILEDPYPLEVNYQKDYIYKNKDDFNNRWDLYTPYDSKNSLTRSIVTDSYFSSTSSNFSGIIPQANGPYTTSTSQTTFDDTRDLLYSSSDKFKSVSGFLAASSNIIVNGMNIVNADKFGSITWVSLDDKKLQSSKLSVITVSTRQQNTGMIWNATNTSLTDWGGAPTLMEPMKAKIRLNIDADTIRLYPLDSKGKESTFTKLLPISKGVFEININQNTDKTTWYGIEATSILTNTNNCNNCVPITVVKVYPSPSKGGVTTMSINVSIATKASLKIINQLGIEVQNLQYIDLNAGENDIKIKTDRLPTGVYYYQLTELNKDEAKDATISGKFMIEK